MTWFFDADHTGYWTCDFCGFALRGLDDPNYPPSSSDFRYCPYCGTRMGDQEANMEVVGGTTKYFECTRCHHPVDPGDSYCRQCGRRFI